MGRTPADACRAATRAAPLALALLLLRLPCSSESSKVSERRAHRSITSGSDGPALPSTPTLVGSGAESGVNDHPLAQPLTLRPGTGPSLEWLDDSEESLSPPSGTTKRPTGADVQDRIAPGSRWPEPSRKPPNHWSNEYYMSRRPAPQYGPRPVASAFYSTKLWSRPQVQDALVFSDLSYGSRPLVWGPPTPEPVEPALSERSSIPAQRTGPSSGAHRRVSERKCAEYAKLQTERVVALPLVPDPKPSVNHVQKCEQNPAPLVVGGQDARLHEFPHMAAIGYTGAGGRLEWNCGGSLISDMFVLTAAHCTATAQGPPKVVRLGDHNLDSGEDGARHVDVTVSSMVRHPDYRPPSRYDDIGLLRLSRKVPFSSAIRPACLYTGERVTEPLIATGWGLTEQLGERSQVLQKVFLNLVEHETCSSLYSADATMSSLSRGIAPDSQMCAGVLSGGKDTCQGDSGGPLQTTSQNNQCVFLVVGVTSFGKVCAARNSPGVYTRVSKYVSWIERHVWPQEKFENRS